MSANVLLEMFDGLAAVHVVEQTGCTVDRALEAVRVQRRGNMSTEQVTAQRIAELVLLAVQTVVNEQQEDSS